MVENSPEHACCFIPKNLSYEGPYQRRLFYPRLVFERLRSRLSGMDLSANVDSSEQGQKSFNHKSCDIPNNKARLLSDGSLSCDDNCDSVLSDEISGTSDKVVFSNDEISDESNAFDDSDELTVIAKKAQDYGSLNCEPTKMEQVNAIAVDKLPDEPEPVVDKIDIESLSETLTNVLMHRTSSDEDCKDSDHEQYQVKDFEFLDNEPVRRSRSLKATKTPPGTPHRKKAVRFADALGLDLESVKTIMNMDNPPRIPASATKDLVVNKPTFMKAPGQCYMAACFSQPGCAPDFIQRVQTGNVVLENCMVDKMTISGTVRVANISFHKRVVIRYTFNNWVTSMEITASYVQNSNDGATDRFSFVFSVPPYFSAGCKVQFCIAYYCESGCFWDNNYHHNYILEGYADMQSEAGGSESVGFY